MDKDREKPENFCTTLHENLAKLLAIAEYTRTIARRLDEVGMSLLGSKIDVIGADLDEIREDLSLAYAKDLNSQISEGWKKQGEVLQAILSLTEKKEKDPHDS